METSVAHLLRHKELLKIEYPDFVIAYSKTRQRIEVRCICAVP